MGWNTSALFVQGLDPDAAVKLLGAFARTPEKVTGRTFNPDEQFQVYRPG